MSGDPLATECADMRRSLARGDVDDRVLDHLNSCTQCSNFAVGLQELDATMAALPPPAPPLGAVDRAVARFGIELASGRLGPHRGNLIPAPRPTTGLGPPPVLAPQPSPDRRGSAPPTAPVTSIGDPDRRHARRRVGLVVAGLVAAILVVAVVFVPGPSRTPPASAETLHQAVRSTRAHKSARLDLSGDVGLSVLGVTTKAPIQGHGETQFPDRARLSVSTSTAGIPLHQDIISIGEQTWTRLGSEPFQKHQNRPGHGSVIDQILVHPDQALEQLSRVGNHYRSLGVATATGVKTRRVQFAIPGDSFHAFGDVTQHVDSWTVTTDIGQQDPVLRRITVDGHGQVDLLGSPSSFTYHLQVALKDFGTPTDIQPPR